MFGVLLVIVDDALVFSERVTRTQCITRKEESS